MQNAETELSRAEPSPPLPPLSLCLDPELLVYGLGDERTGIKDKGRGGAISISNHQDINKTRLAIHPPTWTTNTMSFTLLDVGPVRMRPSHALRKALELFVRRLLRAETPCAFAR